MLELGNTLLQLVQVLFTLVSDLVTLAARWLLVIVWVAWWLWFVDWRKLWPTLAAGSWAPFLLLSVLAAIAWACIAPGPLTLAGFVFPNFLWKLGAVMLLFCVALFCGWLQMVYRWHPPEIELEPPPAADHGHHDHGHGHH
jgi:hypothetical protein